jgi:hypothetical protein
VWNVNPLGKVRCVEPGALHGTPKGGIDVVNATEDFALRVEAASIRPQSQYQ